MSDLVSSSESPDEADPCQCQKGLVIGTVTTAGVGAGLWVTGVAAALGASAVVTGGVGAIFAVVGAASVGFGYKRRHHLSKQTAKCYSKELAGYLEDIMQTIQEAYEYTSNYQTALNATRNRLVRQEVSEKA